MTGRIIELNAAAGMVGVQTEAGGCSVIEILRIDQVDLGDNVRWTGDQPLGRERLTNVSKGVTFTAFFQNHGVDREDLREQLFLV